MTRRGWTLILGASLCATALPGCAWCVGNRIEENHGEARVFTERDTVLPVSKGTGQWRYPGLEEQEPDLPPPRRPDEQFSARTEVPSVTAGKAKQDSPPGQKIADFQGPPPALAPCDLPPSLPDQDPALSPSQPSPSQKAASQSVPNLSQPAGKDQSLLRALDCLLNSQPAEALQHLRTFDAATQEWMMRLLPALVMLNAKGADELSPTEIAGLQDQVQGLLTALRNRTDLVIDKLCLCDRIDGYGQYKPLRDGHAFQAGTTRDVGERVLVYVELRNLTSVLRDRYFVTSLNDTLSIVDAQGTRVWIHNYGKKELPPSLEPRSDCLRIYDFFVPASLPPGQYTLTLEIADETRQPSRAARKSVDFIIAPHAGQ